MILAKTTIGPQHHGRKMSLRAFEFARVEDGSRYELARDTSSCPKCRTTLTQRSCATTSAGINSTTLARFISSSK